MEHFELDGIRALEQEILAFQGEDPSQYGYGVNFSNPVFSIHRICQCCDDDCPWCVGCSCDDTAFSHLIDGQEVTHQQWVDFYDQLVGPHAFGTPAYEQASQELARRRTTEHRASCDFCLTGGIAAAHGGAPGKSAPHFWHPASGLKVWAYKHWDRGQEVENPHGLRFSQILAECLNSLVRT